MGNNQKTIFIPFAACAEYYLEHTIKSALANAEFPERIHFGVFNQISDKQYSLIDNELFKDERIVYAEIICKYPLGVGTARMNASLLSKQNHDFLFQTDAHTIFTKNWDSILIDGYEKVKNEQGTDKIVFSGMQGGGFTYDPQDRETLIFLHPNIGKVSSNIFYENDFHKNEKLKTSKSKFIFNKNGNQIFPTSNSDHAPQEKEYEEIFSIVATFLFAPYSIIRDVMHDPQDPYHGDQTNYTLRLISRGYKIFTPMKPALFSLGKFINEGQDIIDEEYHWRSEKYFDQSRNDFLKSNAMYNYNNIANGTYFGYWGAPDMESLTYAKDKMGYLDL